LQRARKTLSQHYSDRRQPLESEPTAAQKKLLDRYLHAWEVHDVDRFVALLQEDATAVMPPWLQWFTGRDAIGTFFSAARKTCGGLHLIPTAANCQPSFGAYELSATDKRWKARAIHVLTLENELIAKMTVFVEPNLFADFGLPQFLPHEAGAGLAHDS
jgi:RNA polymerase sigma-70 factor, ECF subfamily